MIEIYEYFDLFDKIMKRSRSGGAYNLGSEIKGQRNQTLVAVWDFVKWMIDCIFHKGGAIGLVEFPRGVFI